MSRLRVVVRGCALWHVGEGGDLCGWQWQGALLNQKGRARTAPTAVAQGPPGQVPPTVTAGAAGRTAAAGAGHIGPPQERLPCRRPARRY